MTNKRIFHNHLSWAEVDLNALKHNYRELKKAAPRGVELLAVVKADAYGHGMIPAATHLNEWGMKFFGVSNAEEGILLRKHGIRGTILLFESTLANMAKEMIRYNLTPTVCTLPLAASLNRFAKLRKRIVDVHVKVDTGMGRLGVWHEDALAFIKTLKRFSNLNVKGIYTHFAAADTDRGFTKTQVAQFAKLLEELRRHSIYISYTHAANSMGLIAYKHEIFNLVRPGLMLYGLYPAKHLKSKIHLKPVLSVKSKIIFLKRISRGHGVSYGRTFIARKNMTVATLPIGYSDGYFRSLSNKAEVLINGKRCKVLGRVTMDQIVVDVTKLKSLKIGTEAVILGAQGREEISADELARYVGTIHYEVVCNLGNRLVRIYNLR